MGTRIAPKLRAVPAQGIQNRSRFIRGLVCGRRWCCGAEPSEILWSRTRQLFSVRGAPNEDLSLRQRPGRSLYVKLLHPAAEGARIYIEQFRCTALTLD